MPRYLMRAASSPFLNPSHHDALLNDVMNSNSGNMIFQYSIVRALMRDDVEIDFAKTNKMLTEEQIRDYNSRYDAFIIPLANAFRASFVRELEVLINYAENLDMPCVVIGVGYQGSVDDKIEQERPWDDAVKRFCEAILQKSSCIGLRGETTAKYLEYLGFERDKDFMVIGCPSLFLYGKDLPSPREFELSEETKFSINSKVWLPGKYHAYLKRLRKLYHDYYYIIQNHYEMKTLYTGMNLTLNQPFVKGPNKYFPIDLSHEVYRNNRARAFVSAHAWIQYLKTRDISFGSRIHGNIASILAGTPAYVLVSDSRIKELVEYHNIPHSFMADLDIDNDSPAKLFDLCDFNSVLEGHEERFNQYQAFMDKNGLPTIFKDFDGSSPFDERLANINFEGPIIPFLHQEYNQQLEAIKYRDELLLKERKRAEKRLRAVCKQRDKALEAATPKGTAKRAVKRVKRTLHLKG